MSELDKKGDGFGWQIEAINVLVSGAKKDIARGTTASTSSRRLKRALAASLTRRLPPPFWRPIPAAIPRLR